MLYFAANSKITHASDRDSECQKTINKKTELLNTLYSLQCTFSAHTLLHDTIRKLGLRVEKFELGIGPSNDTIVAVRGTHLRHQDLGGFKTPYILHSNERKPVDQLKWYVINKSDFMFIIRIHIKVEKIPTDQSEVMNRRKNDTVSEKNENLKEDKQSYKTIYKKEQTELNEANPKLKLISGALDG